MSIYKHCGKQITEKNKSSERNECDECCNVWDSLEEGPPTN